jgi:nucleoside-diphosphate-sugar epimerase
MAPKGIATYNIGSGTPKNIRELILLFGEHYGKQVEIKVSDDLVRANDPKSLYCDSTKFRDTFGWQSQSCDSRAFVKLFFEDIGAVSATSCEK